MTKLREAGRVLHAEMARGMYDETGSDGIGGQTK